MSRLKTSMTSRLKLRIQLGLLSSIQGEAQGRWIVRRACRSREMKLGAVSHELAKSISRIRVELQHESGLRRLPPLQLSNLQHQPQLEAHTSRQTRTKICKSFRTSSRRRRRKERTKKHRSKRGEKSWTSVEASACFSIHTIQITQS